MNPYEVLPRRRRVAGPPHRKPPWDHAERSDKALEDTVSQEQPETRGEDETPVPRDLPDQQASDEEDHWEPDDASATTGNAQDADDDVPDTDEAGTGRRGAPHTGGVHPDQPVPDEPSG
ncbi:hypothetical protein GCM10009837_46480 [Streptomyces durmitorensis]